MVSNQQESSLVKSSYTRVATIENTLMICPVIPKIMGQDKKGNSAVLGFAQVE